MSVILNLNVQLNLHKILCAEQQFNADFVSCICSGCQIHDEKHMLVYQSK